MDSSAPLPIETKIGRRAELVGSFVSDLAAQLDQEPAGPLHDEILGQRSDGGWQRATTPLDAGWFSTLQHTGAAASHASAFLAQADAPTNAATSALLVRGALEGLSIVAWLLEPNELADTRSLRALSEVRHSTLQLKKLYRDQGVEVDEPPLGPEGTEVEKALARVEADAIRAGGSRAAVPQRPDFTELIENLFGRDVKSGRQGSERTNGPIYRFLSALSHGTKWAMNHYATPIDGSDFVTTRPTAAYTEMLLFYLGLGVLRVSAVATNQLEWVDLTARGGQDFINLGPCDVDYGHEPPRP